MCRAISIKHPKGKRCRKCLAAYRALTRAKEACTKATIKIKTARTTAFGLPLDLPAAPEEQPKLSKRILRILLDAALKAQAAFDRIVAKRAAVRQARQEAAAEKIVAEANEARRLKLEAASAEVETAWLEVDRLELEVSEAQRLAQDLTPHEGWPEARPALEQQLAFALVEVDDLAEAEMEMAERIKPDASLRTRQRLASIRTKLHGTRRHVERLTRELKDLPTYEQAIERAKEKEASLAAAEHHAEQLDKAFRKL